MENEYYSSPEVAKIYGVSASTIWTWVQKGRIKKKYVRMTGKNIKILKSHIDSQKKLYNAGEITLP